MQPATPVPFGVARASEGSLLITRLSTSWWTRFTTPPGMRRLPRGFPVRFGGSRPCRDPLEDCPGPVRGKTARLVVWLERSRRYGFYGDRSAALDERSGFFIAVEPQNRKAGSGIWPKER